MSRVRVDRRQSEGTGAGFENPGRGVYRGVRECSFGEEEETFGALAVAQVSSRLEPTTVVDSKKAAGIIGTGIQWGDGGGLSFYFLNFR